MSRIVKSSPERFFTINNISMAKSSYRAVMLSRMPVIIEIIANLLPGRAVFGVRNIPTIFFAEIFYKSKFLI